MKISIVGRSGGTCCGAAGVKGWRGGRAYHLNIRWGVAAATTTTAVGERTSL